MNAIERIKSLKENEGILCLNEDEAKAICQLMKEAGLKWSDGDDYDTTDWTGSPTAYFPADGENEKDITWIIKKGYPLHHATSFLQQESEWPKRMLVWNHNEEAAKEAVVLAQYTDMPERPYICVNPDGNHREWFMAGKTFDTLWYKHAKDLPKPILFTIPEAEQKLKELTGGEFKITAATNQ